MDWVDKKQAAAGLLQKYRWAGVVLLAGLILMALPQPRENVDSAEPEVREVQKTETLQQELQQLLSQLQGAGKVQVLLSMDSGPHTHYQTDLDRSDSASDREERQDTVILSGADRNQSGLIQQIDSPVWRGAVVLCQGADSPQVRLAVVDAVATATGLSSDKISVLRMK